MKIIDTPKLDFDNVLIVPRPNNINSRADVSVTRTFQFKHSHNTWTGVPIIAANMTTVASFKMAEALSQHQIMTAIPKYYEEASLIDFWNNDQ